MRILLSALFWSFVLVNSRSYSQDAPVYEQAMRLLEREVQLMREFVADIGQTDDRVDSGPVWRGISNVFSDLSGMFGNGGQRYYESYQMYPQPVNHTELARRARIRLEETKREIIDLNKRISEIISQQFNRKPYGRDYHVDRSHSESERLHDSSQERVQKDDENIRATTETQMPQTSNTTADEIKFPTPSGFIGFELPIRGLISRELLLQQLYEEEYEAVDKMSSREIGEMIRPMIVKGTLNVNHGQCRIANLLDENRMLKIEP
ncbi:hypothetical protein M3Y94_00214100 [Aphelenchoides besseyi]|nr:hypothetical protein M3Y94_00214100 [Aphelenchoides besseyi]KAI6236596.1 hypothetical protein M3Y95_00174500 [Aphelenchoides besseyi]